MLRLFFLSFFMCTVSTSFAQINAGIIKGMVTTTDNKPVALATVQLKGIKRPVLTNNEGAFLFKNIQPGSYEVEISLVGYETSVLQVKIASDETTIIEMKLTVSQKQLKEVIVSAGRNRETIDEVPSSVSIISLKTLEQNIQITSNLSDILDNKVPGLAPSTGLSSNFGQTLRGRNLLVMVDGVPQSTPLRNGALDIRALDPAVIERVEVVKGATAIYGNGAAGGLINYLTRTSKTNKLFNSQTSLGMTGSLVSARNSVGSRLSQLFYGNKGKFTYVLSGVYEQTGEHKDADGDVLPPVYALGETDSYNGFAKLGYQFNGNHKVQFTYNYYSSRQSTNYITKNGNYAKGEKTTAELGVNKGVPQGVKGNHNVGIQFSGLTNIANTRYDIDVYYQSVDNIFFYSEVFLNGGVSRILSKKNGARFVLNTPFEFGSTKANLSYGLDAQTDVTSQPLVDGRIWVPEMKMFNLAPFAQAKINLFKNLVFKGGVRYERINIGVKDYATLPTKNTQNGNITPSIAVKGGDLKYNTFVFNTGVRYNISGYFSPYVSYSQGFSVSDIGLVLRAAKVNDIAKINTEAVVINNYEIGFVSKIKNIRFEATGYTSKSELGANSVFVNGVYEIVRSPERIHGFELIADVSVNKNIQTGVSYSYVEGKTDVNNNGKFDDKEDQYLPGQRIAAPKLTGHFDYAIIPGKFTAMVQYTGVLSRNRFDKNSSGSYDPFKGPVKPYHLVSSLVSYNINQTTSLNLGIENLLNENYYTARSQWGATKDNYTKGRGAAYRFTLSIKL